MALPSSGAISLSQVNVEFGRVATTQLSMGDLYRGGPIVPSGMTQVPASGAISLAHFRGADNSQTVTLTAGKYPNMTLRDQALSLGWDGQRSLRFVINAGAVVYGTSGNYACLVAGSFPNGLRLINYGYIVGHGGNGGGGTPYLGGGTAAYGTLPQTGGMALCFLNATSSSAILLENYGWIAGGGGGGGGGSEQSVNWNGTYHVGGGGGGGGGSGSEDATGLGGAGGAVVAGSYVSHPGQAGAMGKPDPFFKVLVIYNGLANAGPPGEPGVGGLTLAEYWGHGGDGGRGGDWGSTGDEGYWGLWWDGTWMNNHHSYGANGGFAIVRYGGTFVSLMAAGNLRGGTQL